MAASTLTPWLARDRLVRLADGLAIGVVVSLPWSTSATSILVGLWLLALLPTLDGASLRRALAHPAGGLPVAFCALAVIGTLWADVAWGERLGALRGLHKLLMIPLLLIQFRRSDKGPLAIGGFLASCTLLLAVSWVITFWPGLAFWHVRWSGYSWTGVPFKDYLVQSGEFLLCAFMLAHLTFDACVTSQFEQQLRAVCGLPLGSTELLCPAAMANLLGDLWDKGEPDWEAACASPSVPRPAA